MIKILFISEEKPILNWDGFTLRIHNLCKNLKMRNNKIYLFYFNFYDSPSTELDSFKEIAEQVKPLKHSFNSKFKNSIYLLLFYLSPFLFRKFKSDNIRLLHKELKNFIKEYDINLVHVQGYLSGIFLHDFNEKPKLLDLADSTSLYFERQISSEDGITEKLRNYFYYYLWKGIERNLLKYFEVTTTVSPLDAASLKKLSKEAEILVVRFGVDHEYYSSQNVQEDYPSIIFHGNINFPPNTAAISYIHEKIFPFIKSEVPNTKFYIVGRNPTQDIMKLHDEENIIVTGEVPDIREYISKASVVLVPMQSGSGLKTKILEALSMEKPVVTNIIGSEALEDEIKKNLLIGSNSDEIVEYTLKFLKNKELRLKMGKNNRIDVIKHYNWIKVAEKYEKIYHKLINDLLIK